MNGRTAKKVKCNHFADCNFLKLTRIGVTKPFHIIPQNSVMKSIQSCTEQKMIHAKIACNFVPVKNYILRVFIFNDSLQVVVTS